MAESKKIIVKVNCASHLTPQTEPDEVQDTVMEWRMDRIIGALVILLALIIASVAVVKHFWTEEPQQTVKTIPAPNDPNKVINQTGAQAELKNAVASPGANQVVNSDKLLKPVEKLVAVNKNLVYKVTKKKIKKPKFKSKQNHKKKV
jgi:hypothetical protein